MRWGGAHQIILGVEVGHDLKQVGKHWSKDVGIDEILIGETFSLL